MRFLRKSLMGLFSIGGDFGAVDLCNHDGPGRD